MSPVLRPLVSLTALQHQPLLLLVLKHHQSHHLPLQPPHLHSDLVPHLGLVSGAPEGEGPAEDLVLGLVRDGHADVDGQSVPGERIQLILRLNIPLKL